MFFSQWQVEFSCELAEISFALLSFQVFISNIWSNFRNRSCAAFHFLIFIYFMDYSSYIDANLPCLSWRLQTWFLITARRAPAAQRLRGPATTPTRHPSRCIRMIECECESAVMTAAPSPPHAGSSRTICPARLGPPSAWGRLNGWRVAHNSKCSGRYNNLIPASYQPPRHAAMALLPAGPAGRNRRAWGSY